MSEHDEQAALFRWAAMSEARWPELRWLFAVPNGGHRHKATAGRLKAEGVKAGVPDVIFPIPFGPYAGLAIEMKHGKNRPTASQVAWLDGLAAAGHCTAVCYGWEEARAVIEHYLGLGRPARLGGIINDAV